MGNTIISSKVTADKDRDLQVVPRVQEVRLVAFLDIMGFKDMVARHFYTIEDKLTKLSKFISRTIMEADGYQYMIFSDSIIIYPIKGAIAKGECTVCMDAKPFFFGQPIIDAYTLEENVVLYGVVLHNTVESLVGASHVEGGLVFDYKVPLKGGASKHYVLNWFADDMEANVKNLNSIRKTVSDSPRRYIDNTEDSIEYYVKKYES